MSYDLIKDEKEDAEKYNKRYNEINKNLTFIWGRGYKRILETASSYNLLLPVVELLGGLMITYYTDIRSQLKAQKTG